MKEKANEDKDPEEVITLRQAAEESGRGWQSLRIMLLTHKLPKGLWWKNGPYRNSPILLKRKVLEFFRVFPEVW